MKASDFEGMHGLYQECNGDDKLDESEYDKLIGIPYTYYQMDSIDYVQEYVLPFAVLCEVLRMKCNMQLVYKKTYRDIKKESSNVFPYSRGYSQRQMPEQWTNDEEEVLDTYAYALFKRVQGPR